MRFEFTLCIVLIISSPILSEQARAANSVEIVWISSTGSGTPGSSTIDAVAGDRLVAQVRITPDAGGVSGYATTLSFDADLADELDLVSATEMLPPPMALQLSPGVVRAMIESNGAQAGSVGEFEALNLSGGPTTGTMVAGELMFDVTANVATDGDDVTPGFSVIDGMGSNSYLGVTPVFVGAAVNLGATVVPSLSTSAMIVLALLLASFALLGTSIHQRC
ncbi:MAG TPA: hypothetical protein VFG22_09290 [Polyangiales bacterium]|nr:hypothetical protein [Polyangiales bacterium]